MKIPGIRCSNISGLHEFDVNRRCVLCGITERDAAAGQSGQLSHSPINAPFAPEVIEKARRIVADYHIVTHKESGCWFGSAVELPTVFADGVSQEECVKETREALATTVAYLLQKGETPPAAVQQSETIPPDIGTLGGRAVMTTRLGIEFDLLDPRPEMVHFDDIAGALSKICRFGGHTPGSFHYSVAEHSCLCVRLGEILSLTQKELLAILLHDAAEAYLGDWIRPIKQQLPQVKAWEQRILTVIGETLDVDFAAYESVIRLVDNQALFIEKVHFFPNAPAWHGEKEFREDFAATWDKYQETLALSFWGAVKAERCFKSYWENLA